MKFVNFVNLSAIVVLIVSCATGEDVGKSSKKVDVLKEFNVEKDLSKFEVTQGPLIVNKQDLTLQKTAKVSNNKYNKKSRANISLPQPVATSAPIEEKSKEQIEEEEKFLGFDKVSETFWSTSTPRWYLGEKTVFRVTYFGVTVGDITMESSDIVYVGGLEAYRYIGNLKSAKYYSMIYALDDSIETLVDIKSNRPMKYSVVQRESGKNADDLQLYDFAQKKSYYWYKRDKKGQISKTEKESAIPTYAQNMFSIFPFIRGLPLDIGKEYIIPIMNKGKVWQLSTHAEGTEQIVIQGASYNALKVSATTEIDLPKGNQDKFIFWFESDERRKPLKFEAKVKLGSLAGEVTSYSSPSP